MGRTNASFLVSAVSCGADLKFTSFSKLVLCGVQSVLFTALPQLSLCQLFGLREPEEVIVHVNAEEFNIFYSHVRENGKSSLKNEKVEA